MNELIELVSRKISIFVTCRIKTGRFLFHNDESEVSAQILNRQGLAGGVICFSSLIASLIFISTDIIVTEDVHCRERC